MEETNGDLSRWLSDEKYYKAVRTELFKYFKKVVFKHLHEREEQLLVQQKVLWSEGDANTEYYTRMTNEIRGRLNEVERILGILDTIEEEVGDLTDEDMEE